MDTAQLNAIASGMPEMVIEILADFRTSFGKELKALAETFSEVEAETWRDFFHRAKGSGGTLGLLAVQSESQKREALAKEGSLPQQEDLAGFSSLLEESCEEALKFLESLKS